jgi:hypothetical protein
MIKISSFCVVYGAGRTSSFSKLEKKNSSLTSQKCLVRLPPEISIFPISRLENSRFPEHRRKNVSRYVYLEIYVSRGLRSIGPALESKGLAEPLDHSVGT